MQESHELDGTTVVVDRATPKVPYFSEIELNYAQILLLAPTSLCTDTFVIFSVLFYTRILGYLLF